MKRILTLILFPLLHVSAIAQYTASQVARVEQTRTQQPVEPQGEAGESASHVSLTPSTSQRIIQPNRTTLAINSLNGALNADLFPGEDIGQKINAAIDALPESCGEIYIPAGVYAWHTTVIKPRCVKIHGAGGIATVLNWTRATGIAMVAAGSAGSGGEGGPLGYPEGEVADLTINGPGATTGSTGLLIGADPTGRLTPADWFGDHQNFNRVRIRYFGTGVTWGNNGWSDTIHQSLISNNGIGINYPPGLKNSGESLMISATKVQNSATQGLNLVGFADFYFYGFSCDYNPTCGTTNIAHFYGAHFEQGAGRMLTIAGSSLSATEIIGGDIVYTRSSGAESDVIYVNSANNPMFRIVGTYINIAIGHTFKYLVNWNGSGEFAQLDIEDLPYPGGPILNLTNSTCSFIGCYIHDGSLGVYVNNFRGGFINTAEARFPKISTDGGRGASMGSTLGYGSITGGTSGLRIDPMKDSTASPLFLQEGKMNASSFEATFRSVRSTTLSGTGNAVACLDASGRLYRGTSTGCP